MVTGSTGFVGRRVVSALVQRGHSVRAVAHRRGREEVVDLDGVETRYADVFDPDSCSEVMQDIDAVVHLVAIVKESGRVTFNDINYLGTANVVTTARGSGVRRFVHMGAVGTRDDPRFPYFRSKWLGEQTVATSGVPCTILRSSLVFGPGDEFINTLAGVVKAFLVVPVAGNGRARFQPIHVDDVARCLVESVERDHLENKTIEVGGPQVLTYNQIVDLIALTYFVRRVKVHIPIWVMRILVWFMQRVLPNPPVSGHQLDMLAIDNVAAEGSVEEVFGFTPRPVQGNIDYIRRISYTNACRISAGFMPRSIRDH